MHLQDVPVREMQPGHDHELVSCADPLERVRQARDLAAHALDLRPLRLVVHEDVAADVVEVGDGEGDVGVGRLRRAEREASLVDQAEDVAVGVADHQVRPVVRVDIGGHDRGGEFALQGELTELTFYEPSKCDVK